MTLPEILLMISSLKQIFIRRKTIDITPWTQDANGMYIRRSEDIQEAF